jgi:hypothetical protein
VKNQHNLSGLLVENDDSTAEELHSLQVQARARCGHTTDLNACLTGLGPERCILLSDLFRFLQPKFVLLLFYALFFSLLLRSYKAKPWVLQPFSL